MSQPRNHATQHIETGGVAAVDIECINLVPEPDLEFGSPDHWTLFCIPTGYKPPGGDIETDVLFRRGPTLVDERELIERFLEWVRARQPAEIVTYNGEHYDYPILRHRAAVTATESRGAHNTPTNLELVIGNIKHTDLFPIVKENAGFNVPLESALNYHDIPTVETQLDGDVIDGSDMPDLGEKIINGNATPPEVRAVETYAESDVDPLFELHSKVGE